MKQEFVMVVGSEEWAEHRRKNRWMTQASADALFRKATAERVEQMKQQLSAVPTWVWVVGGLVLLGIFAARSAR